MEDCDGEEQLKSRSYQTELEEIAMARNTIIHLPTGSGKTFIAIRIIQRNRHDLKLPWGAGGKRTFFLVNTVPLVTQQRKFIQKMCAVKSVAGYSGEDYIDYWDKNRWDAELSEHEVIVMTSQILADMLTHSYIRIQDINLLIFDECHHAVVDHPMRLVMKHFDGVPVKDQPRVLGLTATLLNANVNIGKVEDSLRELETTFHATIATVNELGEVLSYSTNPNESVKVYRSCTPTSAAREAINIIQELQTIVMNIQLPAMTGDPSIKLERGQRDISTDPKKLSNYTFDSYSTNPNESVKVYRSCTPTSAAREAINIIQELQTIVMNIQLPAMTGDPSIKLERGQRDISTDPKKIVKEVRRMLASLIMFIEELGAYGGQLSCTAYSILLERLKRKAISAEEEHLYKISITHITMYVGIKC
ncbi:type III restriction enzyme, res subunit domain-containing protein [Phthorimaea operculella]|nr:type III restriction enzyme, res subunit domain-containing protein [Phthorimaea operculella]